MQLPLFSQDYQIFLYENAFCRMDISAIQEMSDELDVEDIIVVKNKLDQLNALFQRFKFYGNDYLFAHRGICNNCTCNPGRIGFLLIGNYSNHYTEIVLESKKGKVTDWMNCGNFIRGQFPEIGNTALDFNGLIGKPSNISNFSTKSEMNDIIKKNNLIDISSIETDEIDERIKNGQKLGLEATNEDADEPGIEELILNRKIDDAFEELSVYRDSAVTIEMAENWCNKHQELYHHEHTSNQKQFLFINVYDRLNHLKNWKAIQQNIKSLRPFVKEFVINGKVDFITFANAITQNHTLRLNDLKSYIFFRHKLFRKYISSKLPSIYYLDKYFQIMIELPDYELCYAIFHQIWDAIRYQNSGLIRLVYMSEHHHKYRRYIKDWKEDIETEIKIAKHLANDRIYFSCFEVNELLKDGIGIKSIHTPSNNLVSSNQNIEDIELCIKIILDFYDEHEMSSDGYVEYFSDSEEENDTDIEFSDLSYCNDFVNNHRMFYLRVKHNRFIPLFSVFCEIFEACKKVVDLYTYLPKNLNDFIMFQSRIEEESRTLETLLGLEKYVFDYLDKIVYREERPFLKFRLLTLSKTFLVALKSNRARKDFVNLFLDKHLEMMKKLNVLPAYLQGVVNYHPDLHGKYYLYDLIKINTDKK
jgi:hypothetical protein